MFNTRDYFEKNKGVKFTRYAHFMQRFVKKFNLKEGSDYIIVKKESTGGRPSLIYFIDEMFQNKFYDKFLYGFQKEPLEKKYLYIVKCTDTIYKIGITKDITKRLFALGSGNPDLKLIDLFYDDCKKIDKEERFVINKYCMEREFFVKEYYEKILFYLISKLCKSAKVIKGYE